MRFRPTYTKGRNEAVAHDAKAAIEQYQAAKVALTTDWPDISSTSAPVQEAFIILRNNQLRMLSVLRFLGKEHFGIED